MSDLTITHAGSTVTQTRQEVLSNNKKLNQMKVDLIDVEPTVSTSAYTAGDLMFAPVKIENAVAVKGGSAIIQSIAVANTDALTGSFDMVFTQSSNSPGDLNDPIASETGLSDANADKVLGITSITNMVDVGPNSIGGKTNIGMVIKAPENSRDIYVFGIAQSTDNPTSDIGYKLRIGIVQD